jgi:hypothetical protein
LKNQFEISLSAVAGIDREQTIRDTFGGIINSGGMGKEKTLRDGTFERTLQ